MSRSQVELGLHGGGDVLRVLDDLAVHVGDVERSVRAGLDLRRPEPVVFRGEEFRLLLIVRPPAGEGHAVGRHDLVMHQVVDWLGNEDVRNVAVTLRVTSRTLH